MEDSAKPERSELIETFSTPMTFGRKPAVEPFEPSSEALETNPNNSSDRVANRRNNGKRRHLKVTDGTKTNIVLSNDLLKRAKVYAINHGVTLTEVFNSAISEFLRKKEEKKES